MAHKNKAAKARTGKAATVAAKPVRKSTPPTSKASPGKAAATVKAAKGQSASGPAIKTKLAAPSKPTKIGSVANVDKPVAKTVGKMPAAKPSPVRTAVASAPAQQKVDMTSHTKKTSAVKSPPAAKPSAKHVAAKAVAGKSATPAVKPVSAEAVAKAAAHKAAPSVKPAAPVAAAGVRPAPVAAPRPTAHASAASRVVPAAVGKPAGKLTAPVAAAPSAAVATPKQLAEKAAAARQATAQSAAAQALSKKPVSSRHGFKTNEFVVYPAHGVGRIVGIEEQEIAGMSLELFVITFEKEKLTLRVPTGKAEAVKMRKLAEEDIVRKAMDTLKGRARIKRTMWSRRAQEYVAKINSGDLVSIAEVVRDLYRSEAQPEQSYSERQLYEDALDRMAREIAAVEKLDERGAVQRITEVLSKSARGRRIEAGEETADEVKAA